MGALTEEEYLVSFCWIVESFLLLSSRVWLQQKVANVGPIKSGKGGSNKTATSRQIKLKSNPASNCFISTLNPLKYCNILSSSFSLPGQWLGILTRCGWRFASLALPLHILQTIGDLKKWKWSNKVEHNVTPKSERKANNSKTNVWLLCMYNDTINVLWAGESPAVETQCGALKARINLTFMGL